MSSPPDSLTDIGTLYRSKTFCVIRDFNQKLILLEESALNKKRGRAQSVEPTPAQDIDDAVRFTTHRLYWT
jgi:hypothetical protein